MNIMDFRGTGKLLRFYLKRNRITRAIWILTPVLLALTAWQSYASMFVSQTELIAFVDETILNPVTSAVHGFILTKDIPGLMVWNIKTVVLVTCGIFSILAMTGTTRGEEEAGRSDLLMSGKVGRQAQLAASALLGLGTNAVMGLLLTLGLLALGLPTAGSLGMGMLMAVGCAFFTALAAVISQLTSSRRTASSLSMAALALLYAISFFNNVRPDSGLSSYITPFRWFFVLRPFEANRAGILIGGLLAGLLLLGGALLLSSRRDIGEGVIPGKKGRADASPSLKSVWALSFRMHRGLFLSWALGLSLFATAIGSMDALVAGMLNDVPVLASWMSLFGAPEEAFVALMIFVMSLLAAVYGIAAAQRVRSEESEQRLDLLLSTKTARGQLLASHMIYSLAGVALILLLIGLGVMLGQGLSGSPANAGALLAALYKLPAVWTMCGIAVLLFGLFPRISTGLGWGIFCLFVLLQLLWEIGFLPETAFLLSPFGHVYPTRPQTALTFLALLGVAAALYVAGFHAFRKRDIQQ